MLAIAADIKKFKMFKRTLNRDISHWTSLFHKVMNFSLLKEVKQKFYIHLLLMTKKMYCSSIGDKREFGLYKIFIPYVAE